MILRKIEVENFRQLTGRFGIDISRNPDRPVTVILGENGAGKTTFLHALLWCLYGKKDFDNPEDIVSYKAIEDAAMGSRVVAQVELTFEAEGRTYFAQRMSAVEKLEGGRQRVVDLEQPFSVLRGENGEMKPTDEPKRMIQQLLPEDLSGFFFFRGEDLEQLVAEQGSSRLSAAVRQFVHLQEMERATGHLRDVEKSLEKQVRQRAEGEVKTLSEEIERIEGEIEDLEQEECRCLEDRDKLAIQREEVEERLAEIEEVRPLVERKRTLMERGDRLNERVNEIRRQLNQQISSNGYLFLQGRTLSRAGAIIQAARDRGEIPVKYKPQFVADIIEDGTCICGRAVDEEARSSLEAWKEKSRLGDLESAVVALGGHIHSLEVRRQSFSESLEGLRIQLAEGIDQRDRTRGELNEIGELLEGRDFQSGAVRGHQESLRAVNDQEVDLGVLLGKIRERHENLDGQLKEFLADRKSKVKGNDTTETLLRRIEALQNVRGALERLCQGWLCVVQEYLDSELKSKWAEIAQLDRRVEFSPEFRLLMKERGGDGAWRASASSSANKRALALAFVAALIRLAAEASSSPRKSLEWFPGGKYPLVMDAPFATMDTHFKRSVPSGLRSIIPQLILISNHDQWKEEVEEVLSSGVGKAYVLRLHGAKEARTIPFRGNEIDYVVPEIDTAFDWTEIEEIQL